MNFGILLSMALTSKMERQYYLVTEIKILLHIISRYCQGNIPTYIRVNFKFVPEILLHPHSRNQTIRVTGETLTHRQGLAVLENVTGKKFEVSYKSLPTLLSEIETLTKSAGFAAAFLPVLLSTVLQYPLASNFDGITDNWRYPTVIPTTVKEFIQQLKQ
jgi:hypothetical protein